MNLWIKERLCPSAADRLLVVLSDLEMGTGGVSDDFPQSESVIEVLARYDDAPYDAIEVVFVFNGDTFDFLKTSVDGKYTHHVDLNIARRKFARIAQAHSGFLNGLADRLQQPRRSVHFVVGNHDPELLFIGVQQDLALWLRAPGRVFVHPWAYTTGDVRIEHGSQGDSLFRMDPAQPFIKYDGRDVIAYPWGSVALLDVAMPMQPTLYHVDRLKPRDRVLALLPEVKELILSSYWRYWTGERLRSAWGAHDPMTQISWTLFKEVMYRWRSGDMNLSVRERYQGWMAGERAPKLWIVGHEHSPAVLTCVDRTLLVTGCWRNEYALSADGRTQTRLTNVYAEVFMTAGNVVRSELVEVAPAPLPDGYCPESVFDILPAVRELLASSSERQADVQAQKDQEAREKA
ncbi:MAG: UDP-2,3-diacylglucosamine pyrophosphatase LpxH [Myxococcota bacterium]|jgi:UDP-2,3-diacylglucosamine pyrophosphatase LpxH